MGTSTTTDRSSSDDPYRAPVPSDPPPGAPRRTQHLARFWLMALLNVAIAYATYDLFTYQLSNMHRWEGSSLRYYLYFGGYAVVAALSLSSAAGLVFRQTWAWYLAVLTYLHISAWFVLAMVGAIIRTIQGSPHAASGILISGFIAGFFVALTVALLDRKARRALDVRWPHWLSR